MFSYIFWEEKQVSIGNKCNMFVKEKAVIIIWHHMSKCYLKKKYRSTGKQVGCFDVQMKNLSLMDFAPPEGDPLSGTER